MLPNEWEVLLQPLSSFLTAREEGLEGIRVLQDVLREDLASGFRDEEVVLDAYPDAEIGEIEARLVRDDGPFLEGGGTVGAVVGVETDVVGDAMVIDEVDVLFFR